MIIYLITAQSGMYDDTVKWNVISGFDKVSIQLFKDRLDSFLDENNIPTNPDKICSKKNAPLNQDDPSLFFNWNDHGVKYNIEEIKVLDNE